MISLCPVCCSASVTVRDNQCKCRDCGSEWVQAHMKMAYIAHPFNGLQENVADVENIVLKLLKKYPKVTFYSPLHATGFFYFAVSYEDGMEHCYEALRRCDELWLCDGWERSRGCNLEVKYAKAHNIPIFYLNFDYSLEAYHG